VLSIYEENKNRMKSGNKKQKLREAVVILKGQQIASQSWDNGTRRQKDISPPAAQRKGGDSEASLFSHSHSVSVAKPRYLDRCVVGGGGGKRDAPAQALKKNRRLSMPAVNGESKSSR
jgi:hypothetical protein